MTSLWKVRDRGPASGPVATDVPSPRAETSATAPPAEKPRRGRTELWPARVKNKDLMLLSRQLSSFVRAGIPILDALTLLQEDVVNPTLARTLAAIADDLREGVGLSAAIERHPTVFPPAYRSMMRSAELTGNLDEVLDRLASYLERDEETRSKLRSASVYPAVIAFLSVAVTVLLVVFVLPKFRLFFTSFGRELPLPTRMLLGLSDFLSSWWWAVLLGGASVVTGLVVYVRRDSGREAFDRLALRVPVIGQTVRYALVERFSRVFGSMVRAGVPLGEAMDVAATAANNRVVTRALVTAREAMMQGEGIAGPLGRSGVFPPAAVQMLRVGEDTGSLDDQLDAVAVFYERELDYQVKKLTSLFEPAVLVVMGVVVGFVALALVTAMYGIYQNTGAP